MCHACNNSSTYPLHVYYRQELKTFLRNKAQCHTTSLLYTVTRASLSSFSPMCSDLDLALVRHTMLLVLKPLWSHDSLVHSDASPLSTSSLKTNPPAQPSIPHSLFQVCNTHSQFIAKQELSITRWIVLPYFMSVKAIHFFFFPLGGLNTLSSISL